MKNNPHIQTLLVIQNVNPSFDWVKDLPLIPYEPKPTPPPFE